MLNSPPHTWDKYLKAKDSWGIIDMEFTEAKSAIKNFNIDPSKLHDAAQELTHTAAALLHMRVELMMQACKKQQNEDK